MVASGSLNRGLNTTDAVHKKYTEVVSPHIDSFDSFVRTDIRKVIDFIEPVQVRGRCVPGTDHAASLPVRSPPAPPPGYSCVTLADSPERPRRYMDGVTLEPAHREAGSGRGDEAAMLAQALPRDGAPLRLLCPVHPTRRARTSVANTYILHSLLFPVCGGGPRGESQLCNSFLPELHFNTHQYTGCCCRVPHTRASLRFI